MYILKGVRMFDICCGWLRYIPFERYELPRLEAIEAPDGNRRRGNFKDQRTGKIIFNRKLYRLHWAGQLASAKALPNVRIPDELLQSWPTFAGKNVESLTSTEVSDLLAKQLIPDSAPESLAYHLAVNRHWYAPEGNAKASQVVSSVAALPARCVDEVLDGTFAVDDRALATLQYLKWHAESHHHHPLFMGFDTCIREELMTLSGQAAALYFKLLEDYLYDFNRQWWAEHNSARTLWPHFALYLHWVGRTGTGLYANKEHSGLYPGSSSAHVEKCVQEDYLDLLKNLTDKELMWKWRAHGHVDGDKSILTITS